MIFNVKINANSYIWYKELENCESQNNLRYEQKIVYLASDWKVWPNNRPSRINHNQSTSVPKSWLHLAYVLRLAWKIYRSKHVGLINQSEISINRTRLLFLCDCILGFRNLGLESKHGNNAYWYVFFQRRIIWHKSSVIVCKESILILTLWVTSGN